MGLIVTTLFSLICSNVAAKSTGFSKHINYGAYRGSVNAVIICAQTPAPDSVYKPSVLTIKVFDTNVNQPLRSAVAVFTSRITGKSDRVDISNGRLERTFTKPDQLDILVTSPGYTTSRRQLAIDVSSSGKVYEFDAVLTKITYSMSVRAIDTKTRKDIPGIRFTLTGPAGTEPIQLRPDPATGLAKTTLPTQGTYQITSTASGYNDFTQRWVVERDHSDVLFELAAKKPAGASKPTAPVSEAMWPTQVAEKQPATAEPPATTPPPTTPLAESVQKPSVLAVKLVLPGDDKPRTSAVASITSLTTGDVERYPLINGQLEHKFTAPDEVSIEVMLPGYVTARRKMRIELTPEGKRYEFRAELDRVTIGLIIWAVDSRTDQVIHDVQFTVGGRSGMAPVKLTPDPVTGRARIDLPSKGSYTFTSTAKGYNDMTKAVVLDSAQNEARVMLTAIPPVVETKPEPKPVVAPPVVEAKPVPKPVVVAPPVVETKPVPKPVVAPPIVETKPAPKPVVSAPVVEAKPVPKPVVAPPVKAVADAPVASTPAVAAKSFGVIEKGKPVRLDNIYFDQSSPVLRPESAVGLDQLYNLLKEQPTLRIEIRGYTDNQGDFDLNVQLSRDRCQAVVNYLVSKGIAKNRLKAAGRGPLDAVAPNTTEENRRKNRRVEFEVL